MERLSGRVVGKRQAPRCLILFSCPKCWYSQVLDAYDGPPSCIGSAENGTSHVNTFMRPVTLSQEIDPDDVLSENSFGPHEVICTIHHCKPSECFNKHYPWSK